MWTNVVIYGLWAALPVFLALLALRPVSTRELNAFSWRYSIELDSETLPAVTRSVRRGRTARLAGAALGLSLYPVLDAVRVTIPNQSFFYGLGGYLLGAFISAVVSGTSGVERRSASLVPRLPSDYLPRAALITPIAAVGIGLLADVVYAIEPHRLFANTSGSWAGLPVGAIAVVATLVAIRAVVARPQPLSTPSIVAVDDAVRTQAVHTLAGVGISLALFGAASSLFQMGGYASPDWLHVTGIVAGFCAFAGGIFAWTLRGASWRVKRSMVL